MATKTAVIILCDEKVLIWAIPPLLPQPPDFYDHNPTHMPPPLFTIPFPDISSHPTRIRWEVLSCWYFGSSQPLYFDMLCQDAKLHRFQITLQPDLRTVSLHTISISEDTPHDFDYVIFEDYRICEDTLVSCWFDEKKSHRPNLKEGRCGVYTGSASARFANVISDGHPAAKMLLPDTEHTFFITSCPASGRLVLMDDTDNVFIVDLF